MSLEPWARLGGREVCDCRVFKVRADRFCSPRTGETHEFFVIDSPDWVNLVALTDEGVSLRWACVAARRALPVAPPRHFRE
ncbi:MAG TPA: hypothetical protein DFS52_05170, partial [Myxococcales bacterium]|nr:hypothetical protein [Myxococcales bacterium]